MVNGGGSTQVKGERVGVPVGVPVGPELVAALERLRPRAGRRPWQPQSSPPEQAGQPGPAAPAGDPAERATEVAAWVSEAVGWQRVIAWADSRLNEAILGVTGIHLDPDDEDWGREEISAALRLPGQTAAERIEVARALATRLFATGDALRQGAVTLRHATEIVKAVQPLTDDDACARVEAAVLAGAAHRTAMQVGRHARREVIRADPQGADERHRRARRNRRVEFTPMPDCMAELRAYLPADTAARLRAAIDELAGRTRQRGDDRTLDQRRADALAALGELGARRHSGTAGSPPDSGASVGGVEVCGGAVETQGGARKASALDVGARGSRPATTDPGRTDGNGGGGADDGDGRWARRAAPSRVALIAPLSTALGATDLPGELIGYGPVPPMIVRELAADGKWEKWITDPGGTVTDLGRSVYRPPARLAALVRATHPRCVFPGCSQPSHRCDLDHAVRWVDGGPTSSANLIPLCGRHHRAKDEGKWRVERRPDGSCEWTSPAGRAYHVDAAPALSQIDTDTDTDVDGQGGASEDWTVDLTAVPRPRRERQPDAGTVAPVDLGDDPPPPF